MFEQVVIAIMVVEDTYIGHTHILIHDDFIVRDPEKIEEILDRIASRAFKAFSSDMMDKEYYFNPIQLCK